nr:unnamed protein product [Digitaria exilis]
MEWTTVQHLDLRHSGGRRGASARPMQPHAAAFRASQAIVAVAIGTHVVGKSSLTLLRLLGRGSLVLGTLGFDSNSKGMLAIVAVAIGTHVVGKSSLTLLRLLGRGSLVLGTLGFDSNSKGMLVPRVEFDALTGSKIASIDLGARVVRMAYSPTTSHVVIAILEYVAYAEGLIRAYNIQTYAVHYTLQLAVDSTIKLMGAGAFGFHPTLEWIFVGDRGGTLLAWDVSTERPSMIGITQAGSQPITSVSWLPTLRLLITIAKDGALQVWKTRVIINPNRQPMETHFFERAAIETMDITKVLTLQGGEAVYPLPRIKNLAIHPKFNLAAVIFADMSGTEAAKNKAAYTREGRRQLFALLQGARGSTAAVLKEKLLALGSSGILAEHQLQAQLQEQHLKGQNQLTISDVARKAFLHSHFMEGHAKSGPISRLPLVTISDSSNLLRDVPVCQPYHLELNFFNKENRVVQYPVRAFYLDGFNLMAHNLSSGSDNLYKKLYSTIPSNMECHPKSMSYSPKQHLFLVVFELSGPNGVVHEVVLYWEQTDLQTVNSKGSSIRGRDAAFLGPDDNQYAILEEDRTGLNLFSLKAVATKEALENNAAVLEENTFADNAANSTERQGPLQFTFESEVDRIFSSPLVLLGALNDRLLLVNPTDINPRQEKGVEIRSCLVGLLEPLLIGFATMQQYFEQKLDLSEVLYQITSRLLFWFDSLRITPRSLDILAKGPPVCGDLAVSLSQAGPQFTQIMRCNYAIKALRFSTALSILKDEFLRSRDYPQCPPTSHLFQRFRELGYACIKYGQFDSAKETFEVISDHESMLDLFICHLNPSALRRLAQKLEESATDSELRRYLERILRVRSTGWTQGVFANFAAESMVPKGPEWAGGNWDIKTPTNIKTIPQWELAGEVMPYMKTTDAGIPSVVADHIGVYLGVMKGRGNVVEVSEKSLVKAIAAASSENAQSVPSVSAEKNKAIAGPDSVGDTLARQLGVQIASADEQARAAEEFKKTLYGVVDDGSSDEDESTSKTKKIHIRIRDKPAASTVDVNKLKEATKQLGLGPPLNRTRSLSGTPQEFNQAPMQPGGPAPAVSPAMPNTAIDLFGTNTLVQPQAPSGATGPVVAGMGVTAGPIPEDFFQNTIPSHQLAAQLPPPGIVLSRMAQPVPPGMNQGQPVPNQNMMPNVGLPDGGVPPQALPQQSQFPQQSGIPMANIGLPDGGVPPQSQPLPSQTQTLPSQPQSFQPGIPAPSQPIDLSALVEGPGAAKQPARPPAPTAVRPGQVPRGAPAAECYKMALAHLEQNQLTDALSCLDEAFLALAKDQSREADIKAQATICAQYKIAVALLQEIARLQRVQGAGALSAKEEMARLSRHLASLPIQAKHRINCIRTAIKRNMEVQNYAYAKQMLDLLYSKAPPTKQDELKSLIDMCVQRGLTNKSIDPFEDPSQFCSVTLSRLSTIGHDVCDLCGAKFLALSAPGCVVCGMGSIKRSDALAGGPGPVPSPFG